MQFLVLLLPLLLLAGCAPGFYTPPPTALHHFESTNELHLVAKLGGTGAVAWNPLFRHDTIIDTNGRSRFFQNDTTGEWERREVSVIDTTDRARALFVALTGSYTRFAIGGSGASTRQIEGELAVGAGERSNGRRIDLVAGLAGGYYYAIDQQFMGGGLGAPLDYRYRAATLYHLRPSLSLSGGFTGIYDSSRSGIAFGLIGRVAYPIVLSTTDATISHSRLMWDGGWYFHASLGQLAQLEAQIQLTGIEFFFGDDYITPDPDDVWSHVSGQLALRIRLVDLFS